MERVSIYHPNSTTSAPSGKASKAPGVPLWQAAVPPVLTLVEARIGVWDAGIGSTS